MLVAFGAAAGQHACAVAAELGIRQVLLHPDAGVLSAYGIGRADITRHAVASVGKTYSEAAVAELSPLFDQLTAGPRDEVLAEGVAVRANRSPPVARSSLSGHRRGADHRRAAARNLRRGVRADSISSSMAMFTRAAPLEIVAARVEVVGAAGRDAETVVAVPSAATGAAIDTVEAWFSEPRPSDGRFPAAAIAARRSDCRAGDRLRADFHDCYRSRLAGRSVGPRRIAADAVERSLATRRMTAR